MKNILAEIEILEHKLAAKSKGFKGFDDPWKVMSPEDRREANRLFILAMKAFPSSPKQIQIREQLNVILKKYGLL